MVPVLAVAACASPAPVAKDISPPAAVGADRPWETYGSGQAAAPDSAAWHTGTAWGHKPKQRTYSSAVLPPPSQPGLYASAKPAMAASPAGPSSARPSAVQPLPTATADAAGSDAKAVPAVSEWTAQHVPESFRSAYASALSQAALHGTAKAVEPATGNVYAISSTGKSGRCVAMEVIIMSPEGKLPIISRGYAEHCG